jgi:hypothetical protein
MKGLWSRWRLLISHSVHQAPLVEPQARGIRAGSPSVLRPATPARVLGLKDGTPRANCDHLASETFNRDPS